MNTSRLMAGASRFAHFAGLTRAARRAADDDHQDNDDEPKGKKSRRAADDDDDGDDEPKGKKSRRAADDDDGDDEPKGKKSRRAADDDDDGDEADDDKDEMTGRSAAAKARARERERIGAILGHRAAARDIPLAVSLAVETTLTRREAISVLKKRSSSARDDDDDSAGNRHSRPDRSSRNRSLSEGPELTGKGAVAASWAGALERVGVKVRK